MEQVRIFLTGFGAFPGAPSNPTQALAHRLAISHRRALMRAGIDLRTAILPVVYADVASTLETLLRLHRPDVVVHLGLAARRKTISIETRARNRLSVIHPDAARRLSGRMHAQPGGEPVRPARWPAARLAAAVARAGFAAQPSIDAGDYLCNQALYLTLGMHEGLCGFIHVPKLRGRRRSVGGEDPSHRARNRLPTLCDLENGVLAAIRLLAVEHRRGSPRHA